MKTFVLEPAIVKAIDAIGRERQPAEACGVLLDRPYKGKRVWEMPNRSKTPLTSFQMLGSDIALTLEHADQEMIDNITFWHTHPNPAKKWGPSKEDFFGRQEDFGNLIVILGDEGPKPIWF